MNHLLVLILLNTIIFGCSSKIENKKINLNKLYLESQNNILKGNYKKAIKYLEILNEKYPLNIYSQQIQLNMIYVYYKLSKMSESIKQINKFLLFNPNHKNIDYVLYMYGLNAQKIEDKRKKLFKNYYSNQDQKYNIIALKCFSKIIKINKKSLYIKDVKKRIEKLKEKLAKFELSVIRYYIEKRAYVAVFNRAKNILKKYPHTRSSRFALKYFKFACNKLNIKLKNDTLN